ncbi:MAG: MotA/TolQ/ExbB proton channel family protein [Phycisphaeraceae bacterium]|nr:MotA/TolQ/ExbB proton channel family protein [Phycisphaeraceae bacterium]
MHASTTIRGSARALLFLVLPAAVLLAITALAFAAPGGALRGGERTGAGGSFAGAFFISMRTDAVTGEKEVELLGSLIIWGLLGLSIVSMGMIGMTTMLNQRRTILPPGAVAETRRLLQAGEFPQAVALLGRDESFFGRILAAALREAPHGHNAMLRHLEDVAAELAADRLRRIELLNVLGQVSPMIGLFGTVYGMILAFHSIVLAGGAADPVLLAGGIGTALTTTFWGLVVAIPALAGYAIVRGRVDALTTEATVVATDLLRIFRPRKNGAA